MLLSLHQRPESEELVVEVSEVFIVPTAASPLDVDTQPPTATPERTPEPTAEPVIIPVNISEYQGINSDVDGWIFVEGTDIDYPVLYDTGEYYLNHTYHGKYRFEGSIFYQDYNSRDFIDFNTVLYGHNMLTGSMFGQLHRFEDRDFFDANRIITIYTEQSRLTYRIFAAYTRDNTHIMAWYSFDTEDDRQRYIDEIYTYSGYFDMSIDVKPSDRIITLSTCTGWSPTRFIVQGVLVEEIPAVYAG